jgi:hypothetical protein
MLSAAKELFERFVFDPSLIDLVVWFPYLSWHDFIVSAVTVLAWRMVSERMERFASFHVRRACAGGLLRLALMVRPEGPYVPPRRRPRNAAAAARLQKPRVAVQRGFAGPASAFAS